MKTNNFNIILPVYLIYVLCAAPLSAQTIYLPQNKFIKVNYRLNEDDTTRYKNHYLFENAFSLIEDMLCGTRPKSFKDAVFAVENAYHDGQLDKSEYDAEINRIATGILYASSLDTISPTRNMSLNWCIFSFFTKPCHLNHSQPLLYDIRTLTEGREGGVPYGFVTHLLKTGNGSCRSLPYLYKILADEVGAEAFLALAPMHCFIRHQDHNGKWWNFETTVGRFRSSGSIIEEMHVTEEGIRSGIYMTNLDENAELVLCLKDLLGIYEVKTGFYSNFFVRKTYELGMQYSTPHIIEAYKVDDMKFQLDKKAWIAGCRTFEEIKAHPVFGPEYEQVQQERKRVDDIGYYEFSKEEYLYQYERAVESIKNKE